VCTDRKLEGELATAALQVVLEYLLAMGVELWLQAVVDINIGVDYAMVALKLLVELELHRINDSVASGYQPYLWTMSSQNDAMVYLHFVGSSERGTLGSQLLFVE
jgi:hypothetical protein